MNAIEALVLGVIQGVTEFLPISSSGHLVIVKHLMQADPPGGGPIIELTAHLGTLLAVVIFFRQQVIGIAAHCLWRGWFQTRTAGWRAAWWDDPDGRMSLGIVVATFVTGVIGLAFQDFFEDAFDSVRTAGIGFLLTAALLAIALLTRKREGVHSFPTLPIMLGVGFAQGLAILPGLSRSGSTIVTSLAMGLKRDPAFAFSFLISVPAILGATVLEFAGAPAKEMPAILPAAILFLSSMLTGMAALVLLKYLLRRGSFGWFLIYVLPLGLWATFFL